MVESTNYDDAYREKFARIYQRNMFVGGPMDGKFIALGESVVLDDDVANKYVLRKVHDQSEPGMIFWAFVYGDMDAAVVCDQLRAAGFEAIEA